MGSAAWHVVAYDIRSPQRLRRVQKWLRAEGYALQKSVFLVHADSRKLAELRISLGKLISPRVDDVRGYPVQSYADMLAWGYPPLDPDIYIEGIPTIRCKSQNASSSPQENPWP